MTLRVDTPCVKPLLVNVHFQLSTVNPVLSSDSKEDQKLVFKIDYRLMLVKSIVNAGQKYCSMLQGDIAECSKGSIMQYF